MAIDFRMRPPYGEGPQMGIYKGLINGNDRFKDAPLSVGRKRIPSAIAGSMDMFMNEMDSAGIDYGVLMGRKTNHPVYGNTGNKPLYELAEKYDGRFFVFAGINPSDEDWREQIEEGLKHGIKGVGIDAGWYLNPIRSDAEELMPVYKMCEEKGLIASITSSIFLGPDVSYSDPVAIHRVAARFPKLKIVVPHASWPHIPQMLGVALICPNVYLMPDCYFYNEHIPFADDIADAANGYLMGQLLFASSYPVCGLQAAIDGWTARPLCREAKLNSLHYNAAKLLGL